MNILKKIANKAYESVSTEDIIEPITTIEVQLILHKFKHIRTRKPSHPAISEKPGSTEEMETGDEESLEDVLGHDYSIASIFKSLPKSFYTLQHLSQKVAPLDNKLNIIKKHIVNKYPVYMELIQQSLGEAKGIIEISTRQSRPKLQDLRSQLYRLDKTKKHSQKVINLRMKAINMRNLLQMLKKFPRIDNMSLRQLKKLKVDPQIKVLECYKGLEKYINQKIADDNSASVNCLKNMMVPSHEAGDRLGFRSQDYELLLYKFYGEGGFYVAFDNLMMGVARDNLATAETNAKGCYELCSHYVKYMLNFHLICRWHNEYSHPANVSNLSQYCRQLLQENPSISQKINSLKQPIFDLRKKIWDIMLDRVQEYINNSLGLDDQQMLTLIMYVNRFLEIGHRFVGAPALRGGIEGTENAESLLLKEMFNKCIGNFDSCFQKSVISLSESLLMEERNSWSRMPVHNNYRYRPIHNTMSVLLKKASISCYVEMSRNNLCLIDAQEPIRPEVMESHNESAWTFPVLTLQSSKNDILAPIFDQLEEQEVHKGEAVICQTVFPLLKFYQQCCEKLFYLRLISEKILNSLFFVTEVYTYYVFSTFIPTRLKKIIYDTYTEEQNSKPTSSIQLGNNGKSSSRNNAPTLNTVQESYERTRYTKKFSNLKAFINKFKKDYGSYLTSEMLEIKESKQEQKLLRSRVVACQSFKFLASYLSFIFGTLSPFVSGVARNTQKIRSKLDTYEKVGAELGTVIYTECLSKLVSLDTLLSPLSRIKFTEEVGSGTDIGSPLTGQQNDQLASIAMTVEQFMKDFNKKLNGINQGEIPLHIIEEIFRLFCDYVAEGFLEAYCKIKRISGAGRHKFKELLINRIEKEMQMYFSPAQYLFMGRVARYVDATGQSEWARLEQFYTQALKQGSYSYKELSQLLGVSSAGQKMNRQQYQKRQQQIATLLKEYSLQQQK